MKRGDYTELRRQLGLENSAWTKAGPLRMTLCKLNRKDLHPDTYKYINWFLLEAFFNQHEGIAEDRRRKTVWRINVKRPLAGVQRGTKMVRTLSTEGYIHCLDIRKPEACQCILDLIHPPRANFRSRLRLAALEHDNIKAMLEKDLSTTKERQVVFEEDIKSIEFHDQLENRIPDGG
ncbi:hypothetical protein G7Y89_g5940 [Cudoniella acicularis]|uniref:Uncharacterized protein n=1 Tax=Cudoniella acicularis TaxID=354080 RepID=A0A8H4RMA0_9HELO|nr:hypothetical protein G7Y89_g5940 [Cudoniella acicularis]